MNRLLLALALALPFATTAYAQCPPGGCPVSDGEVIAAGNTCGCNCAACNCGSEQTYQRGAIMEVQHARGERSIIVFDGSGWRPGELVVKGGRTVVRWIVGFRHANQERRQNRRAAIFGGDGRVFDGDGRVFDGRVGSLFPRLRGVFRGGCAGCR